MAHRLAVPLLAAAAPLLAAPCAQAALVYVKKPNSAAPQVWIAHDDGSHGRRLGTGVFPAISPDGRYAAWTAPGDLRRVVIAKAKGHTSRTVLRSRFVGKLEFSPDSRWLGIELGNRLVTYDVRARKTFDALHGHPRGFSFSPDSKQVVYGSAGRSDAADAPADLYIERLGEKGRTRVTRDRKSLNPLWGPAGEIVFDRQTPRAGDAPTYNLFGIHPDGGSMRRITSLKIPPLLSGLVPLEFSGDGRRLLAEFEGQDTSVGFAVNPASGNTRALSKNMETGLVAYDLSADGRTVLGMTGGADPANRHDVVTLPYAGGKPSVLVRRAAYPDWTR